MNKPWGNEPTPTTDDECCRVVNWYKFSINLERRRRLRHAERLLELCAEHTVTKYQEQALSHPEAARQEDGR